MPYKDETNLITPPNDTVLWRYFDFARFKWMIERRKLWFSRADKFEDPLEGVWTDAELHCFSAYTGPPAPDGTEPPPGSPELAGARLLRSTVFVNCWRQGAHESMAMWDIYGKGSEAVAIKTTVGLLKRAFEHQPKSIRIAEVEYLDWNKNAPDRGLISMWFRKNVSYMGESEVRALIWGCEEPDPVISWQPDHEAMIAVAPLGIEVEFDPLQLITEVIVGPRAQSKTCHRVEAIMSRLGLPPKVRTSDLLESRT